MRPLFASYGLRIASELPLTLPVTTGLPDVRVRTGSVAAPTSDAIPPGEGCWRADALHAWYAWSGVGAFRVSEGRAIVCAPAPGAATDALGLTILGPLLATVLHQRGRLVLHASAVTWRGRTIAVAAHSGTGKSTTAAALVRAGADPLTDDILALTLTPEPRVWPGGSGLKLWPPSVAAVGHDAARLPTVGASGDKRYWPLAMPDAPRPLDHLVVLEPGDLPAVERLTPVAAVKAVMERSYCSELLRLHGGGDNLAQAAALVRAVPVWRATRGASLDTLPALIDALDDALG